MLRKLVKYIIVVCQFESFCPMQQKTIPVDKYENVTKLQELFFGNSGVEVEGPSQQNFV